MPLWFESEKNSDTFVNKKFNQSIMEFHFTFGQKSIQFGLISTHAAQLRQPIENSLVLCHLKALRLYTGLSKYELDHYLTNVARVKSTYWG